MMPTPAIQLARSSCRCAVRETCSDFVDDHAVTEVFAPLESWAKAPEHRLRASHVDVTAEL